MSRYKCYLCPESIQQGTPLHVLGARASALAYVRSSIPDDTELVSPFNEFQTLAPLASLA